MNSRPGAPDRHLGRRRGARAPPRAVAANGRQHDRDRDHREDPKRRAEPVQLAVGIVDREPDRVLTIHRPLRCAAPTGTRLASLRPHSRARSSSPSASGPSDSSTRKLSLSTTSYRRWRSRLAIPRDAAPVSQGERSIRVSNAAALMSGPSGRSRSHARSPGSSVAARLYLVLVPVLVQRINRRLAATAGGHAVDVRGTTDHHQLLFLHLSGCLVHREDACVAQPLRDRLGHGPGVAIHRFVNHHCAHLQLLSGTRRRLLVTSSMRLHAGAVIGSNYRLTADDTPACGLFAHASENYGRASDAGGPN